MLRPDVQLLGCHGTDTKNRTITANYLQEDFEAMRVELTAEESQRIRDLVVKASVFGNKWPAEHALGLFADTPLPDDCKEEKEDLTVLRHVILDRK